MWLWDPRDIRSHRCLWVSRECESRIFTLVQVGGGRRGRTRVDLCAIQALSRPFGTFAISPCPLGLTTSWATLIPRSVGLCVYTVSQASHRLALRDLEPASGVLVRTVWSTEQCWAELSTTSRCSSEAAKGAENHTRSRRHQGCR